jgi:hypothetical protein
MLEEYRLIKEHRTREKEHGRKDIKINKYTQSTWRRRKKRCVGESEKEVRV